MLIFLESELTVLTIRPPMTCDRSVKQSEQEERDQHQFTGVSTVVNDDGSNRHTSIEVGPF
jgi:hypothetical protein